MNASALIFSRKQILLGPRSLHTASLFILNESTLNLPVVSLILDIACFNHFYRTYKQTEVHTLYAAGSAIHIVNYIFDKNQPYANEPNYLNVSKHKFIYRDYF